MPPLSLIFDTSPLVTLATPKVNGKPILDLVLPLINIVIAETVAHETTVDLRHPDAVLIKHLIAASRITVMPVPVTPVDHLIDNYPKLKHDKDKGERDTIRLGITTGMQVVIDDQQGYFIAARFELNPTTLQDLLVGLTRSGSLSKPLAANIVQAMQGRYVPVSIQHTLYKLSEVMDDTGNADH